MNWRIVSLRATLKSSKDEVVRREIQEVFERVTEWKAMMRRHEDGRSGVQEETGQ